MACSLKPEGNIDLTDLRKGRTMDKWQITYSDGTKDGVIVPMPLDTAVEYAKKGDVVLIERLDRPTESA
jgi:DNA invertase Pin-like site-specific DNA recombinase